MSLAYLPQSVGGLAQPVTPLDDRLDLPGLEQLPEEFEVALVERRDEEDELPAAPHRGQRRLRDGGFSAAVTYHAYHALDAHILGFTLWQLGHGIVDEKHLADLAATFLADFPQNEYPYMHEHAQQHMTGFGRGQKGAFELVLDLILDGLEELRDP